MNRLIPLNRRRPVNLDTPISQHFHQIIELDISLFNGFQRAWPPHAPHITIFGDLSLGRRLIRGNTGVISSADNDVFQRIKLIP